jgi:CelD/BcsL family acetyltransferase involved in cellulose biosynthesis
MIFPVDPLRDARWADLVGRHPLATVFHTPAWLEALRRTYGYEPVAFTTSAPGADLNDGVVFCKVRSWLTGSRLVSLPFSDHCEPLTDNGQRLGEVWEYLANNRVKNGWRHIELRPRGTDCAEPSGFAASEEFWLHDIDLRRPLDQLFNSFHADSIQRKIRRAQRENLIYTEGRSEELQAAFYGLVSLTRRRHQLPPQPFDWFRNLVACLGPALKIRIASRAGTPIAGILTLRHRDMMVYKYGASDPAFHQMGGMQLLFWSAIQEAQADGCVALDLGRTATPHTGLLTFKDRWGARRASTTYFRSPAPAQSAENPLRAYVIGRARRVLGWAPESVRAAAGRFLYRHVG